VTVAYDAGVLVAADRNDPKVWADHWNLLGDDRIPITSAAVVAQVSRSGKQALLRRFLDGCRVVPFTDEDAHHVGALLAGTGTTDVVDAHLVIVAARAGADVVTADVDVLQPLAARMASRVTVRRL